MAERLDLDEMIRSLAALHVSSLDDDELVRFVLQAQLLANAAHALAATALEEFDRRGVWAADGSTSAAGWAAARTGAPRRALRAQVRSGRVLRVLPSATGAAREGRLSPDHVSALASCERRHPDLAARDEEVLVAQALALDAEGFRVAARHWGQCAEDVGGSESPAAPEVADELHLSRTFEGRWELRGSFSPETGELVHAALEAEVDRQLRAQRDGDPSVGLVASQVRAAALVELVCQQMRREPSDESAPDRYRVAVVVPVHQLDAAGLAGCDSLVYRVVVGARGEVLDVGKETRRWPRGIRRAITHRDGGCVFPGCDRPPSWCDVHHCDHWEDGGGTSIDNGALLCRRHHTFIHRQRWRISIEHGGPVTRKPDGTPHVITPWAA